MNARKVESIYSSSRPWDVQVVEDIRTVEPRHWDHLNPTGNPFVSHGFLATMEKTGCVGANTGWEPKHLCLRDSQGVLIGAMPLYLKYNSFGEFVFDWSWASAYEQHGVPYYPKLVCAVPYSPVQGPRFLIAKDNDFRTLAGELLNAAFDLAVDQSASSIHFLFAEQRDIALLATRNFMIRQDCQFLWENKCYQQFDDFVAEFRSSKRKKLKRERRRVRELGVTFVTKTGEDLTLEDWSYLFRFYCSPYFARGHNPYLSKDFFIELSKTLGQRLIVFIAHQDRRPVAAAILIRSQQRLYGRYWGSDVDSNGLHFEACYYQGIEYAINNRLEYFEPGTQGEHKLVRGFSPTRTQSAHWISHPGFATAIHNHLQKERLWTDDYFEQCLRHLPFKRNR